MTTTKHRRIVNDTLLPLNAIILDAPGGNPIELSTYTVKFQMETETGTAVIAETNAGISPEPTQTFTANATTDLLTCNAHGVQTGDQVILATSTTIPAGLAVATRYYAVQVTPNSFGLATTPNGAQIDITSAGTGTHTFYVVGSVQYTFLLASVATVGLYRGWFTLVSGSAEATFPDDEYGIPIEVRPLGN